MAIFVDDLGAAISDYGKQGFAAEIYAETETGMGFAMIGMVDRFGHMLELYGTSDMLTGFYAMVAEAARDWDGTEPVRNLG